MPANKSAAKPAPKKSAAKPKKLLITAALPYANGDIHLGHLVEYIQADIYARFKKLIGEEAIYICASDCHGTPIEVNAHKRGVKPEQLITEYHTRHKEDFAAFGVAFDNFYTTHSPENKELATFFFETLKKNGHIHQKKVEVIFCQTCDRYLPDRYVKGTCPNCGAQQQYGDVCESCNLVMKATALLNPKCVLCGSSPVKKTVEHYFFKLGDFADRLKKWLDGNKNLQPEIKHSFSEWFAKGLEDWDITRDGPYFGFLIPGEKDKYFYVWLDAPIGYISSTKNFTKDWKDYFSGKGRFVHFIGKDITYFHFLFWPAMLLGVGFEPPADIIVHGFLTVNGTKMSKSRGTFFTARDFLKLANPEYLRFYYASHLSKKLADVNLDFEDFKRSVNDKLVANVGNFAYRVLSFAHKNYGTAVKEIAADKELLAHVDTLVTKVKESYAAFDFQTATAAILEISSLGNAHFQHHEPWKNPAAAEGVIGLCLNILRNVAILIQPIMPKFSAEVLKQLDEKDLHWKDISWTWKGTIHNPTILLPKIEKLEQETFPLQMKVGKILSAKDHPNADSLYVLSVDVGEEEPRQVVAGLKNDFQAGVLTGKHCVFVTNLKRKKIRGQESQAMVMVAVDGTHTSLLEAPKSSPGDEARFGNLASPTKEIDFEEFQKLILVVKQGKVTHGNQTLSTAKETVITLGVADGAVIR